MLRERFPVSNRDMDLISGLIDVFWLGLIWFVVKAVLWQLWHHVTHPYDVESTKQPSSTPPHSDTETLKHLQDLGFVWVGSVPQCNSIGRLLGGPRADWSSVGEEGGVSLGRYQLIGPSVSPSLSDSSCISSVFPESLLTDELMEREFLEENRRQFIQIHNTKKPYSQEMVLFVSAWLTRDQMNRKSNLS